MKKMVLFLICTVFLAGCESQPVFETIGDVYAPVEPEYSQVVLALPEEAAAEVLASEDSVTFYTCDGYDILLETVAAGDIQGTIRTMTGLDPENLTILQTRQGDLDRYDFVWCSASDGGQQICRGAVLSDGSGHYCLSTVGGAEESSVLRDEWDALFASFSLEAY